MWRNRLTVLTLGIIILIITPQISGAPSGQVKNKIIAITFEITDAYYEDSDNDGLEDDVVGHFIVSYSLIHRFFKYYDDVDWEEGVNVKLYLKLVLPSGFSYEYEIKLNLSFNEIWKSKIIEYTIFFYNHATENGWYDFYVGYELKQGGRDYDETMLTFDPEGGNENQPPYIELVEN